MSTPTQGHYASKGTTLDPGGRLTVRRMLTNSGAQPIKVLRLTVATAGTPTTGAVTPGSSGAVMDLRAITSAGVTVGGSKVVQGITLEAPSTPTVAPPSFNASMVNGQGNGGGLNSSWVVDLTQLRDSSNVQLFPNGLSQNASVNLEFLFGIIQGGPYRFTFDVEASF